jgi:hypothetical protein
VHTRSCADSFRAFGKNDENGGKRGAFFIFSERSYETPILGRPLDQLGKQDRTLNVHALGRPDVANTRIDARVERLVKGIGRFDKSRGVQAAEVTEVGVLHSPATELQGEPRKQVEGGLKQGQAEPRCDHQRQVGAAVEHHLTSRPQLRIFVEGAGTPPRLLGGIGERST